ncbi:amino acid adenylation domain-containing protein [Desulfobacterales bacterium HSG17]|nr:amino acid adenylation domain-containing protein [Desulfobacterales bacterium HSG17]
MKHIEDLLDKLKQQNINLWLEDEKLHYRTDKGGLTDSLKQEIIANKPELLIFLKIQQESESKLTETLPQVSPVPEAQHEPFPLNDIQQAYWIGRQKHLELGNLATQVYQEWQLTDLDMVRLNSAWQQVMNRHSMLRLMIQSDGNQRVLSELPNYTIQLVDLRSEPDEQQKLTSIRQDVIGRIAQAGEWPLFDIRVSLLTDAVHLHFCIDMLVVDTLSIDLIVDDWAKLYRQPEVMLSPLTLTFRDYMVTAKAYEENSVLYKKSKDYWLNRLDSLPAAPKLPLIKDPAIIDIPKFCWFEKRLEPALWKIVKAKAAKYELQPSALLLAIFAESLSLWSKEPHFTLNQPLFHRLPLHPQVDKIAGEFTSTILTEIDHREETGFVQRAKQIQTEQWTNLDHRYFSGVQVIRELNLRNKARNTALMPVLFTNLLAVKSSSHSCWGERVYQITQTSQVYLDHIVREIDGELVLYWSVIEELFPIEVLNAMFSSQLDLLKLLATTDDAWTTNYPLHLPEQQLTQRERVNATQAPVSEELLHSLFIRQAQQTPTNIAVIGIEKSLTYQELYQHANQIAHWLRDHGAQPNQLVAIVIKKGWQQVAAAMGILMSGAAYVPIDPELPSERQQYLFSQAEVKLVLTQTGLGAQNQWDNNIQQLVVDELQMVDLPTLTSVQKPTDLAYVIYTSGSTGNPKGVMIDHRGAVNTILDVNQRFEVTERDRILALSALNFDLSVYDIFGLLAVGGAVVMPAPEGRRDPSHWAELMSEHKVTLWNTVSALMQMLVEHHAGRTCIAELTPASTLRLVMMSGDWIPLDLPDRIRGVWPNTRVISLGGATEASIWSICYPIANIDPAWKSIPYGKPMVNQSFQVLNKNLEPCPVWVAGSLYIGGIGLALGYWKDSEKTETSFITHPRSGERLYKTGDLGRYMPDGNIEFLGRADFQVKIQGYRIELGEIESHLLKHPDIDKAIVTAVGETLHKQLIAYIVPKQQQNQDEESQSIDQATYGLSVMQGVLTDPIERLQFKLKQRGILPSTNTDEVALPVPTVDDVTYINRQSYRKFLDETVTAEQLSQLLSCLQPRSFDNALLPKYRYGSAGSLYPIQTYLYIKPNRVTDVAGGFYYYHPIKHKLLLLSPASEIDSQLHGGTNQDIFNQSAFSLFLVAEYQAIEPMYGSSGRDFCLLEAGYISQLLMMDVIDYNLGLCPIGGMNFEPLRSAFGLTDSQEMVHSFLGGGITTEQMQTLAQTTLKNMSLEDRLKDYLSQKLPHYMIPHIYVELSELPLTANGKVNRKDLPNPDLSRDSASVVQPTNEFEQGLVDLVKEIAQTEQVSISDDFIALGINSLDIVQLRNEIKTTFNREIEIIDLFQNPNVQALAKVLSQAKKIAPPVTDENILDIDNLTPEQIDKLTTNLDHLSDEEIEQLMTKAN